LYFIQKLILWTLYNPDKKTSVYLQLFSSRRDVGSVVS
jgi:hypothetical protein